MDTLRVVHGENLDSIDASDLRVSAEYRENSAHKLHEGLGKDDFSAIVVKNLEGVAQNGSAGDWLLTKLVKGKRVCL